MDCEKINDISASITNVKSQPEKLSLKRLVSDLHFQSRHTNHLNIRSKEAPLEPFV